MNTIFFSLIQALVLFAFAPLLSGITRVTRAPCTTVAGLA